MNRSGCTAPAPLRDLLAWWLGEMDESAALAIEEHLLGCGACSTRLGELVALAQGIRSQLQDGRGLAVLSAAFVGRLRDEGLHVREYRLHPGGSVNCTVAPDDDLVVAHLQAELGEVRRLDLLFHDGAGGTHQQLWDIAFDPAADVVVLAPSMAWLRQLGVSTHRVDLVAVQDDGERVLGSYTFNHAPWRQ